MYWEIRLGEEIWLIQTILEARRCITIKELMCHSLYLYFLLRLTTCFERGGLLIEGYRIHYFREKGSFHIGDVGMYIRRGCQLD